VDGGSLGGYEECPSRRGIRRTNHPTQGGEIAEAEGQKVARKIRTPHKDVKNEDRSGNVYENKGPDDNLPDRKGDICAWSHAILHKNTRILWEPSAFLPFFGRWGTNRLPPRLKVKGRGPVLKGRATLSYRVDGVWAFPAS
jgi:hypothetical protein